MIDIIAESLHDLKDVVLLATNTPHSVTLPIECEVSAQAKEDDQLLKVSTTSYTLNDLLTRPLTDISMSRTVDI